MAKMGYVKGQGLGKNNDGVTTHLEVKIRKPAPGGQSSIFDDGEGNKVKSAQVWDVRGGERKKDEPGKFGEESPVVVTWGCVEGVDWKQNANRDDGGIRQDMGDVFSTKVCLTNIDSSGNDANYFKVWSSRTVAGGRVKSRWSGVYPLQVCPERSECKSTPSDLFRYSGADLTRQAVNRFDEGFQYRGRNIRARYYDERKFHAGIYEH